MLLNELARQPGFASGVEHDDASLGNQLQRSAGLREDARERTSRIAGRFAQVFLE